MRRRGRGVAGVRAKLVRRALAGALIAALAVAVPSLAAGGQVNVSAVLAPEIARAKSGKVAVLLPSSIRNDVSSRLYGSASVTAKGYDIALAYAPRCDDSTACFFADFQAGPGKLAFATRVALAHGIGGAYRGISCGASCAPASIAWEQHGVLYSVQYVLGSKASMIALANSAIEAGPR